MKNFVIILVMSILTGCASFNPFIGRFNQTEYGLVTNVRAIAAASSCDDPLTSAVAAESIDHAALTFLLYSEGLPKNTDTVSMANNLHSITTGFVKRYTTSSVVSREYCVEKLKIISDSAKTIQRAVGAKPL